MILPEHLPGGNDQTHIFSVISSHSVFGRARHRSARCLAPLLLAALAAGASSALAAGDPATIAGALEARIERLRAGQGEVGGVRLGAAGVIADLYARRGYEPAWQSPARFGELAALLAAAPEHGLDPGDFFLDRLRPPAEAANPVEAAEADLLSTEALIRYGYQRRFGKVDPTRVEPAWNFARGFANGADPVTVLAEAIAAPSLREHLESRIRPGPWYAQLQTALARYREIARAGGWASLAEGATLRAGDRDPRVVSLRERLRIEGDLAPDAAAADPELFDEELAAAVRRFQARHALATDGVVGRGSLAALNVPVEGRIDQLRMSLERVRWLAGDVPETYVVVNVAGFRVGFVRDRDLVWSSRVVVGRAARQTPIFRGSMTYVELNPTWTVPPTILREDILPKVRRDPGYLVRENITVIDGNGRRVDPFSVDWQASGRAYTLRQEPGPDNALGRIKLMFPNPHAVYLHDTPARQLFDQPERTFSSGCIRVEDPLGLAELVLDSPEWTRASLESEIARGQTRRVNLQTAVPVLLVYLTAVADSDGTVRFYRDVYDRDRTLLAALNGPLRFSLPRSAAEAPRAKMRPAPL